MQVHFDFANRKISIAGDGQELLQILSAARDLAPNFPSIEIVTQQSGDGNEHKSPPAVGSSQVGGEPRGGNGSSQTLRQFARSIAVSSAMDRIAVIAYYQKHYEKKDTFSPKEMSDWFVQCGFQKPSQMPVALSDARRKYGYVDNVGHASWRINNSGENLVIGKLQEPAPNSE